jgi:peptidoglycan/LPS O-acetylase OafA/YrhL
MKTYYPTINLLRGCAALLVCLYHFICYHDLRGNLFSPESMLFKFATLGINGVFIFFVISGFVIPLALYKNNFRLSQLHYFLSKRFIRIEIPYLVSILMILSVSMLFTIKNNSIFTFNFQQFIYHILYLIPFSDLEWYNVIYWTLAIEFQFYIAIGLLYCFLIHDKLIIIIIGILLFGGLNFFLNDHRLVFYYSTIFLQGIILFLIETKKITKEIGVAMLAFCVFATSYIHTIEISIFSLLTVLFIYFLEINNKVTNMFGDISYSLYLTHGLIGGNLLYLFSRYLHSFESRMFMAVIALIASLLFAFIFWWLVENPARNLSQKIRITLPSSSPCDLGDSKLNLEIKEHDLK